jgi:hypothetical protein
MFHISISNLLSKIELLESKIHGQTEETFGEFINDITEEKDTRLKDITEEKTTENDTRLEDITEEKTSEKEPKSI